MLTGESAKRLSSRNCSGRHIVRIPLALSRRGQRFERGSRKRIMMRRQKAWAFVKLTRPMFLGGAVLLYLLGAALAWTQGISIDWTRLVLGQLLVTSIQLTTHYANEYYDYEVDAAIGSARTPFSGGSGILVNGQLDRAVALHATQVCLVFAVIILIVCGLLSPL